MDETGDDIIDTTESDEKLERVELTRERKALLRVLRSPWTSPPDQPRWARPALITIALLSGLAYGWGMGSQPVEVFYGAAARSMSMNWHDWFFGAFDPAGTVTIDKLPGELWIQALFLRITGFHLWALIFPQVIEGALTVLVLYRAVRRLAGPLAGIIAALVLATSPITVLLNRGNISDTLLILLLVLAADSASKAIAEKRPRSLLLAGFWIGCAFQAKMEEAWIVIPVLVLVYAFFATDGWSRRWRTLVAFGAVALIVSLSWISIVQIVPRHDRPYVDASQNDSEFQQAFTYNGLHRLDGDHPKPTGHSKEDPLLVAYAESGNLLNSGTIDIPPSWDRLFHGPFGLDDAWLLPVAALSLTGVALASRRRSERRHVKAALLLWGSWLVLFLVIFSDGVYLNSYYVAALMPAVGALCGIGFASAWQAGHNGRRLIALGSLLTLACSSLLLPTSASAYLIVIPLLAALVAVSVVAMYVSDRRVIFKRAAFLTSVLTLVCVPLATSIVVVVNGLGPFDYPYDPPSVTFHTQVETRAAQAQLAQYSGEQSEYFYKKGLIIFTETSDLASFPIMATGKEYMPIGGYSGEISSPTLKTIKQLVHSGRAQYAFLAERPESPDPRLRWLRSHCMPNVYFTPSNSNEPEVWTFHCDATGPVYEQAQPVTTSVKRISVRELEKKRESVDSELQSL